MLYGARSTLRTVRAAVLTATLMIERVIQRTAHAQPSLRYVTTAHEMRSGFGFGFTRLLA